MNRAGFGVSLLCALTTVVTGCSATVAGFPTPASTVPIAQGTPLSTTTASPAPSTRSTGSLSLPALFDATVSGVIAYVEDLGVEVDTPVAIPRTDTTMCLLSGAVARTCGSVIEYDAPQLTEDRTRYGDLPIRAIAAHETGHIVMSSLGADTASTPDADSEARANCITGAFLATDPAITSSTAGEAYNRTPLPRAGQGSYDAYRAGFTMSRDGVDPIPTCARMLG